MTTVYLLHFERPISDKHTCQHYLGSTDSLEKRIKAHRQGKSKARLTQVAKERGISFVVARLWENVDRKMEARLKARKAGNRLCPICNPNIDDKT